MSKLNIIIPITKIDAETRTVYGVMTEEVPDKAGEIIDYESAKDEIQKWSDGIAMASDGKSLGNVRAMHGKVAAGKLTDISFDDGAKRVEVAAKVVDDGEWCGRELCKNAIQRFAVGGFNDVLRHRAVEGRYPILQFGEFGGDIGGQQVASSRERLTKLDEDRPEFLKGESQSLGS